MRLKTRDRPHAQAGFAALAVTLVYAAVSALWVLASDRAVAWFFRDPDDIALASVLKGWLFIGITSVLLYTTLSTYEAPQQPAARPALRRNVPLAMIALLIVATAALGVGHVFEERRRQEIERLQAAVDVKVQQVQSWLVERTADTEFIHGSHEFANNYRRWQHEGDASAGERLRNDLLQLLDAHGFMAVTVLDRNGVALWSSPGAPPQVAPALLRAVHVAREEHASERAGPYVASNGRAYLDFVAPLVTGFSLGFAVLHVDPSARLYPLLQDWHMPTSSGETAMVRVEGDDAVVLNVLRHRPDSALRLRVPLADPDLLIARVARDPDTAGVPQTGLDYRGVESIAVARPVSGTDWLLVTKLDRDEIFEKAYADATWIGLAATLSMFVAGAGMLVLRQRERLALADATRLAQSERLHAMQLLDVVANSSSDAIFAKDRDGRYLLFNREAERVSGRNAAAMLGHDDRSIFPPAEAARIMENDRRVMDEDVTLSFEEELTTADGRVTYLATKGPLHDTAGAVTGMFGISRNITARKRAELALRDSEARFRTLFENAAIAITIHDAATGAIIDANRHALDAFGVDRLDELCAGDFTLEPPYSKADGLQWIRKALTDGGQRFEWKFRDRFGRIVWEDLLLNPIVLDGTPRVIAIGVDITASKAADDAVRRQTEELKAYAAELERFNRATVGRELDMIALKREVNALAHRLGEEPPYDLAFADVPAAQAGK